MDEIIRGHEAIMDRYDPSKKVSLIIDEWGVVVGDENSASFFYQQNSLRDALVAASTLNIFNNHADRVRMANLAQVANVLQSLILTSGDSMLVTPTYHVFDMYKVHQDAKLLTVQLSSPDYMYNGMNLPALNVSASKDSTGAVHISIVNLDPEKKITFRTSVTELPSKIISGQLLTSTKFTDINTFIAPDKLHVASFKGMKKEGDDLLIEVPAKSVVVLELK